VRLALAVLLFGSCRLAPDYVELTGGYGEGEFADRFDQEHTYGELTVGYWLNSAGPWHAVSHEATHMLDHETQVDEDRGTDIARDDRSMPEVREGRDTPWFGDPAFIVSLSTLIGAVAAFLGRGHIEKGVKRVEEKFKRHKA
jgi:hypothetical protein